VNVFSRTPRDGGFQPDDEPSSSPEPLPAVPLLQARKHDVGAEAETSPPELSVRTARKDGREVVSLRRVGQDGAYAIECDVYPVGALQIDPLSRGPYRFESLTEADAFLDEAVRALGYLGCDVQ
jgi:hypothetical protein